VGDHREVIVDISDHIRRLTGNQDTHWFAG
jgi:hypothetical protein